MTYEQITKSNATRIRKFGGLSESSMFSGISTDNGALRYDQEPIAFMSERLKPFDVQDYRNPQIITNTPHTKDIEKRILNQIQQWIIKPDIVYRRVCESSRTLPYLERLENIISPIYSNKLIDNIVRLEKYSPNYYQRILEKKISFEKYQEFFYLLVLIQYVDYHKNEEEFQNIQDGIRNVIDWVRTRVIEDIEYLIQGPIRNSNITLDYEETYKGLISPSNTTKTVTEYLQLTTMQQINDQLTLTRQEATNRENVYFKNPNIAGGYLLSIDSQLNAELYINSTKDLVVDCKNIDLGNSNSEQIDLNINHAKLSDKLLHHDPKIASKKLENLMNIYTMFNIKDLLILKSTFKTSLNAFDKLYIVFPGITMDGRFNQVYRTGTLQVSGHFIESNNEKYWEFVSDTKQGIVYNPTTVHVDSFEFYISNVPGSKTNLSYNNFKISTSLNEYFNCPIKIQQFEDLDPNIYIIRMNDITEGELKILPYTFLYNDKLKTIQLLPTNYEYDTVPRYKSKKMRKAQQKYEANIYPSQPSTVNVIIDEIRKTKAEAKISKIPEDQLIIYLDKPVQPATTEGILERMKKGEISWTFRGQTVEFSGKTIEQIVREFNQRSYSIKNVVDFQQSYIDNIKSDTVTYKGVKYSLIKSDGSKMTGQEFFNMLGIENIVDFAERISAELMLEYKTELNRFDSDILPEQVNPGFSDPKPEDFASLSEYYLFFGLFKPDYDYIIENSEDIGYVNGFYALEDERLEREHKYKITDFYDKTSETVLTSIENPPHDETTNNIVETITFEPSTTITNSGILKTKIIRYPEQKIIKDESETKEYENKDKFYFMIDREEFLKSGEIIKYTLEDKILLKFDNSIGSKAFTNENLYICFKNEDTIIYEPTEAKQQIQNIEYERNTDVNFDIDYPLVDSMIYINNIDYNNIEFGFILDITETKTDILNININGVTTTYYHQIPGFIAGMQINMFREIKPNIYELISFETIDNFANIPDVGKSENHIVKNKISTIFYKNLNIGDNSNIEILNLKINYGLCYARQEKTENIFDVIENVSYYSGSKLITDYSTINFVREFKQSDLKTDFPIFTTEETTDWKYNSDYSEQYKDDLTKIIKDGQEFGISNDKYVFEYYTSYGIKDIRTTKKYLSDDGDVLGDVIGKVNKNIGNKYNTLIQDNENFGFKGKYLTYPIKYPNDSDKAKSEEELKNSICGDIYGYIDENGKFVEIYYIEYDSNNTLDFEIVSSYPSVFTYNNKLKFSGLWRRTILNIQTFSSFNINNIVSVDFIKRSIPLKDNINKTFKIGVDLLNTKFGINDFLYSYAKFTNVSTFIDKPYYELIDLKLKDVGYFERLEFGNQGFDDPMKPKYFINYISHFKPGLIINSKDYGFNTYSVKFKDSEFILETINKDLFGISYNIPIEDPDNFYSQGSRIKMIVELK